MKEVKEIKLKKDLMEFISRELGFVGTPQVISDRKFYLVDAIFAIIIKTLD